MKPIPGPEAFFSTVKNPVRKYPSRADGRFDDFLLFPAVQPGFSIRKDETIFTIGSCFARNVEDHLVKQGIKVPTAHFSAPPDEAPGRPNRVLNQYNPGAMLQCVEAVGTPPDKKGLYALDSSNAVDSLVATNQRPVAKNRATERRAQISELYSKGLSAARTVIITFGLIETWYDLKDRIYLNEAPPSKILKKYPDRFEFRKLGYEECNALVCRMLEILVGSMGKNVILTVSPVPLQITFTGGDAITQNAYSKAVLRSICEQAISRFGSIDYFPSYEMVTTAGFIALSEDNVHVRNIYIDRIVRYMLDKYLE